MSSTFEILGMVGIGLSIVAYLPQMSHLVKEHCSAGISTRSWQLWLVSSVAVGSLAIYRGDYVFITLAATSLLSAAVILILTHRYRGMDCASIGDHSTPHDRVTVGDPLPSQLGPTSYT